MKGLLGKVMNTAFSPKAFSTYAAIGVGVTTVLAILNTRKQCQMEYEKKSQEDIFEKEYTKEEVKKEVKQTFNNYKPTIAAALATVFCINKAENGWVDYSGIINSAYRASEQRVGQLRSIAPGAVMVAARDYIRNRQPDEGMKWWCFPAVGDFPDLYFQATDEDIWRAMYKLNRNYHIRCSASFREFLAFIEVLDQFEPDLKKKLDKDGDSFGWDMTILFDEAPEITPWIDFHFKEGEDGVIYIYPDDWLNPPMYSEDRSPLAYGYMLHPHE